MSAVLSPDPVLSGLRAQWQAKHDEAQAIIGNPAATGPQLVKAEKMFDERDRLGEQIQDREATLQRLEGLKSRYAQGRDWSSEPQRGLPFAGSPGQVPSGHASKGDDGRNQFRVTGYEDAGFSTLRYDQQRKSYEMIAEAGAGTFGEAKWGLLSSFEYRRDFAMYLRKGNRVVDLCQKTLMEGMDDQGGVFSPAEFVARIIGRLPAPTHLRSLVTTLTTGRDTLIMPRKQYSADDIYTTAFRVNWSGEIPGDGTGLQTQVNDQGLLGNVEIPVHTAMMSCPVTRNLIEDSAFPIQAWLESELAQVVDLEYENQICNGPGVGQPQGVLFGALAGNAETNTLPEVILTSTAAGIDYNSLINVQMALAPQYETDSLRWVMNKRSTYSALNKLVDSQNRPLFTTGYNDSGLVNRRQRVLLGDEICLSQLMPSISSTAFPLFYGDLKGYYIAQRVGFSIQVLDQTRAKVNQVELVGRVRFGGKPVEPYRLKILKSNSS